MAMGLYNAFVPPCTKGLAALGKIMEKAAAYCETKKIPEGVLLNTRLTPDMFSLAQQIGVATQQVHWGCALLAGLERPTLPAVEPTFADVKKRIDDAIAYAKTFKPEQIDGQEERDVKLVFPGRTLEFKGEGFLLNFTLPNFYFHYTTAYAILRQAGVPVGKMDFLA